MKRLHSIRFKVTAITVGVILATVLSIIAFCYSTVQRESDRRSVEIMRLVGQDTRNLLDEYFVSIEQSVGMTANEAIDSLDAVTLVECGAAGSSFGLRERSAEQQERLDTYLSTHCAAIQETFRSVASHTRGVIAYYYCINPAVSENEHGFFYSRLGKAGFVEQEPLDARALDPRDMEHNTWYYTTIERGRPSWIGPYTSQFLDEIWISSYLVPIYCSGTLVGVLGMDISLDTMIDQVRPIRVYETGYASLCDINGAVYYHPELEQGTVPKLTDMSVSRELLHKEDSGNQLIRYVSDGERRQLSFSTLRNGMKLVITAPVKEINSSWLRTLRVILSVTAGVVIAYALALMYAMGILTRPLQMLTAASRRLSEGDYDVELSYHRQDEMGELTEAFRQMRDRQKGYIEDLNRRIYTDDLTGLPNMRGFFSLAEKGRSEILAEDQLPALLYFNLIGMKHFNRQFGFEEGNRLICAVAEILKRHYGSELVCRIGQDHFAAVTVENGLEAELRKVFEECRSANEGRTLPLRVGIYRNSLEEVNVSVACDRAKYASDLRRGTYTSGYTYFQKGMHLRLNNARYVANHLDQAIEEGWIKVYYQPLIRAVNGRVCDVEALARWIDPEKGVLSPAEFIPALEDAGLIYKLDLHVLDRILEKLQYQKAHGLTVVGHSVNLSRSDFDACDMVEEIRRRVDEAGIPRSKITIEITESIIGRDFNFIKRQIERFRKLGFPVWMDDFGSGYSSLDVLQSIRFDLIKFDMSFMRKLDAGEDSKIILTKLMEMATAIGVDTVCEGVETEAQVRFLQQIGCSKLQGYYISKPRPLEELIDQDGKALLFEYENPEESAYYEAVGRVNLCDLDVIAADDSDAFRYSFNTLPMGIIEIRGDSFRFLRSNQSCREFLRQYFRLDTAKLGSEYTRFSSPFMRSLVKTCCEQGARVFYDERLPDGSTMHSFARRISVNEIRGSVAVAIAVLSVSEPDSNTTYADIARALAADYYNIYVIDLETDTYIEYSSRVGGEDLAMERHGEHFFASVERDARTRIYAEDREAFLAVFTRENILRELEAQGVFTATYRLIDSGAPMYANMKITRMPGGNRIIMGISIIDAQMRQKERQEQLKRERDAMIRVVALSDGYLSLYTVDLGTGHYIEFSSSEDYDSLGSAKEGDDFFQASVIDAGKYLYPEDQARFIEAIRKENVLREIREKGHFQIQYRLMINGEARHVMLKAAPFREGEAEKLVVGIRPWRDRGGNAAEEE